MNPAEVKIQNRKSCRQCVQHTRQGKGLPHFKMEQPELAMQARAEINHNKVQRKEMVSCYYQAMLSYSRLLQQPHAQNMAATSMAPKRPA
jgi:hypothetical protein